MPLFEKKHVIKPLVYEEKKTADKENSEWKGQYFYFQIIHDELKHIECTQCSLGPL